MTAADIDRAIAILDMVLSEATDAQVASGLPVTWSVTDHHRAAWLVVRGAARRARRWDQTTSSVEAIAITLQAAHAALQDGRHDAAYEHLARAILLLD